MSAEGMSGASKTKKENEGSDAPAFVKDFSREQSKESRSELAQKIRAERTEQFEQKDEQAKLVSELGSLSKQLDEYNDASFLNKIKDYFKMRATREKLGLVTAEKGTVDTALADNNPNQDGKDAIGDFYEKEKQTWANADYAKEDIAQHFTEENLAALSIDDYALLMKRFPSEMVTHVTRQGIRDHTGMFFHSAGQDVFSHGFEKMLEDGKRLKSPLAVRLAEGAKDEAVIRAITPVTMNGAIPPESREQALEYLHSMVNKYDDSASVHFAAEEVADNYYGSEKGNEIFMTYPSAFIASQYYSGHTDATMQSGDKMWNDVWVRDRDEKGMNLDAAITFIPKSARVDPRNGSRYEIGQDGAPARNEAAYQGLAALASHPEVASLGEQVNQILGKVSEELPPPSTWEKELNDTSLRGYPYKEALQALLPIRDKIKEITGITDDRILKSILESRSAGQVKPNINDLAREFSQSENSGAKAGLDGAVNKILESSGARFLEAKNTVSSEEYWQNYFSEHTDLRPSKVVFYEGDDPSKALTAWKQKMGLTKTNKAENMGFAERRFTDTDGAGFGSDRFESMAQKVIDERFPEQEEVAPVIREESESNPLRNTKYPEEMLDEEPPPLPPEDIPVRRPPPPPPPIG